MTEFATPRLASDQLKVYAERFNMNSDMRVADLVEPVRKRGYLTKSDLTILGDWKSPRIRPRIAQNSDQLIEEVTRLALGSSSIKLAVHLPQALVGVAMPVASTLLHWFHTDPFPILDVRALWSMGIEPQSYTLDFWEQYVDATRQLAQGWNTDMRTLDRALWQYSDDHQMLKPSHQI